MQSDRIHMASLPILAPAHLPLCWADPDAQNLSELRSAESERDGLHWPPGTLKAHVCEFAGMLVARVCAKIPVVCSPHVGDNWSVRSGSFIIY